jgi:hypothetical protein
MEDYQDFVKLDAHDVWEKVEQSGYTTIKAFRKDLTEMMEGFRRLCLDRQEFFRLSSVPTIPHLFTFS